MYVVQVCQVRFEVLWSDTVLKDLRVGGGDRHKKMYYFFNDLLRSAAAICLDRTALPPAARRRLNDFAHMCAEKRALAFSFLHELVADENDFNWTSQLRTTLLDDGSVVVRQGRSSLAYSYEFQASPAAPIVSTELKRAFYCILEAVCNHTPVLLSGPPLGGKSTCFDYLVARLARYAGV